MGGGFQLAAASAQATATMRPISTQSSSVNKRGVRRSNSWFSTALEFGPFLVRPEHLLMLASASGLVLALHLALYRSRAGLALRAGPALVAVVVAAGSLFHTILRALMRQASGKSVMA